MRRLTLRQVRFLIDAANLFHHSAQVEFVFETDEPGTVTIQIASDDATPFRVMAKLVLP